jgi:hypothetical protein
MVLTKLIHLKRFTLLSSSHDCPSTFDRTPPDGPEPQFRNEQKQPLRCMQSLFCDSHAQVVGLFDPTILRLDTFGLRSLRGDVIGRDGQMIVID